MDTLQQTFAKRKIDLLCLEGEGFSKRDDLYVLQKPLYDVFWVEISINAQGQIAAKVYDETTLDPFPSYRLENPKGEFGVALKESYQTFLFSLAERISSPDANGFEQGVRIRNYIENSLLDEGDNPFGQYPGFRVYRRKDDEKWYALFMVIPGERVGLNKEEVEVVNLNLPPKRIEALLQNPGYLPAYHMNKKHWVSLVLDETIKDGEIIELINQSRELKLLWEK